MMIREGGAGTGQSGKIVSNDQGRGYWITW